MATPRKPILKNHPQLAKKWHEQGGHDGPSASEKAQLKRSKYIQSEGMGYFNIQSTRPVTLGYSMTDSPLGSLVWIYEKLVTWSDSYPWTPGEILTWVSIYYFSTAGPAASFNLYYANQHRRPLKAFHQAAGYTVNPLGISRFHKEISNLPLLWNGTLGPIVFEKEHERGGHFTAYGKPESLVMDLRDMFEKGGGAFGIVNTSIEHRNEEFGHMSGQSRL